MESYEEERMENKSHKGRDLRESLGSTLEEAKMAELMKTKKELKRASDSATQSWLDSRPLIDELDRLKSGLASAKNQSTMSKIAISEIESQLESTNTCIKSKKEEELKVTKMINEISQALDQTREKLERIKQDIDEERRGRLKLKQVVHVSNQTLWTLQLMLRAVRLESEAFGKSEAEDQLFRKGQYYILSNSIMKTTVL
jgi:chromosome segregation ATPase